MSLVRRNASRLAQILQARRYVHAVAINSALFLDYITQAYSIANDINNAEGIFHVDKTYGTYLCQTGHPDQGLPILRKSLEVGNKAGFSGTDELAQLIAKFESAGSTSADAAAAGKK